MIHSTESIGVNWSHVDKVMAMRRNYDDEQLAKLRENQIKIGTSTQKPIRWDDKKKITLNK